MINYWDEDTFQPSGLFMFIQYFQPIMDSKHEVVKSRQKNGGYN